MLGDTDLALSHAEAAYRMESRDSEAPLVRASIYRQRGDHDMALADYSEALTIDADYAAAAAGMGWVQIDQGDLVAALSSFEQAADLDEQSGEALAGQGAVKYMQSELTEAKSLLTSAVERDASFAPAHEYLGRLLLDEGDVDGAVTSFVQAKRYDPRSWLTYAGLGEAYLWQERWEDAEKQLRLALEREAGAVDVRTNLVSLLVERGRYADALTVATAGGRPTGQIGLLEGAALYGMERSDDAVDALEQALPSEQDDTNARTLLGILYHQQGEYVRAIEQYRAAIASNSEVAIPHLNLGLALFALERYEESRGALMDSVALDPHNVFAHYGLGILHMDYVGDADKAIYHLETYIELGVQDARARDWIDRLRRS
jgi:tetratricopeptide (TPR) repeat protein